MSCKRLIDCYDMNACSSDEWFVRVGGDDPLVSTEGIELMAKQIKDNRLDKNVAMYYSSYDDGMIYGCAVEIFRANKYKEVLNCINSIEDNMDKTKDIYQEHTKPAFTNKQILNATNSLKVRHKYQNLQTKQTYLSIDHGEDFLMANYIANNLYNMYGQILLT